VSVRPSVCPVDQQQQAAGEFAAERPMGRRYQSIAAGALRVRVAGAGAQQQMRVASC